MVRLDRVEKGTIIVFILSWIMLLIVGVQEQVYLESGDFMLIETPLFFKGFFLNLFIGSGYLYADRILKHIEYDIQALLWRVFITTLICTFISLCINISNLVIQDSFWADHPLINAFFFQVEFASLLITLIVAFTTWKRLILHEKKVWSYRIWKAFEIFLLVALISHFFRIGIVDMYFNIPYAVLVIWILVLCVNVRWVPYLNFSQKVASIFQLIFVLLALAYFVFSIRYYFEQPNFIVDDLLKNVFSITLFTFISIYAFASILFMLFNLPTSSVFEQKFEEISLSQSLTRTLIEGETKEDVYKVLLGNAVSIVKAEGGWLEVYPDNFFSSHQMSTKEIEYIRKILDKKGTEHLTKTKKYTFNPYIGDESNERFRSVMVVPVKRAEETIGMLVLLKTIYQGFDRMMINSVNALVAQAGIALHNFRLLEDALGHERIRNEMEIARQVQQRLLPEKLFEVEGIELYARSLPHTEVGGDYYDFYQIKDGKYGIVIADVLGKGISAAFNMAQMKGIFQALVRMNLDPSELFYHANNSLSTCLEKGSFVTACYLDIDITAKYIRYSRAGHCPAYYYKASAKEVVPLDGKGMGLGIIRNDSFFKFLETNEISYEKGDLIFLYTDGVIEAKSPDGEEYGYDRLKDFLLQHAERPVKEVSVKLMEELEDFTKDYKVDDDLTMVLIRF
ncbi:GAF domain-containing SpoIIE family protein phosphatase [Sediminitomix flava]|uniref:Serine phosphatase RsbU (Regulator of sigma subunit) n=1 Tax=Sediminitomix flava TaxID=379075 RepID=A0A315YWL8_SEDFL|nr:PP2C family protein-serine/threonine phosphatase [Sediminitomix flava]PWJ34160.1 serine phosphatase RsbU (regulator of sigma subunit) [Sediminitomix flava]